MNKPEDEKSFKIIEILFFITLCFLHIFMTIGFFYPSNIIHLIVIFFSFIFLLEGLYIFLITIHYMIN